MELIGLGAVALVLIVVSIWRDAVRKKNLKALSDNAESEAATRDFHRNQVRDTSNASENIAARQGPTIRGPWV